MGKPVLNDDKLLTATRVSYILNIATKTLNNWYKWYYDDSIEKPKDTPKLPDYIQAHKMGPRYWTMEDIPKLKEFQEWIPRGRNGVMGDVSCAYLKSYKQKKQTKLSESKEKNEDES